MEETVKGDWESTVERLDFNKTDTYYRDTFLLYMFGLEGWKLTWVEVCDIYFQ